MSRPHPGRNTLRDILSHLPIGAAAIRRGEVFYANHAFRAIFGPARFMAETPLAQEVVACPTNSSTSGTIPFQREERTIHLSYLIQGIAEGLSFCFVRDTTQEVDEMDLLKRQISFLLHDLKNPTLNLELLAGQVQRGNYDFGRISEYLTEIHRGINDSLKEAPEVLGLRTRREFDVGEINLTTLLEKIRTSFELRLNEAGVRLEIEGTCPPIEGMADALERVFTCLIGNAVDAVKTAGREDGLISIGLEENPEHMGVNISVKDNGCGIPANKTHLVGRYGYTSKEDGKGFGLASALDRIARHGGKLTFASREAEGTTFSVFLPIKQPRFSERAPKPEKIQLARDRISDLKNTDPKLYTKMEPALVEECIKGMSDKHIEKNTEKELFDEIVWQILRLFEFIENGAPHVSVANFQARGTEIVIAGDRDSTGEQHCTKLIKHVLGKMGHKRAEVQATRKIEKNNAVCVVFEIKLINGKVPDDQITSLESTVAAGLTQLPSAEETKSQALFLDAAQQILRELHQPGSVFSFIFKQAPGRRTPQLSGFKTRFYGSSLPIDEDLVRGYLFEYLKPMGIIAEFINRLGQSPEFFIVREAIDNNFLQELNAGHMTLGIKYFLNINSALVYAFRAPRTLVINILGTSSSTLPEPAKNEFQAANRTWRNL